METTIDDQQPQHMEENEVDPIEREMERIPEEPKNANPMVLTFALALSALALIEAVKMIITGRPDVESILMNIDSWEMGFENYAIMAFISAPILEEIFRRVAIKSKCGAVYSVLLMIFELAVAGCLYQYGSSYISFQEFDFLLIRATGSIRHLICLYVQELRFGLILGILANSGIVFAIFFTAIHII